MKIGIITDIHYGRDGYFGTKLRRIFRDTDLLLERFVDEMNNQVKPDLVVQLGDLIEDTDLNTDRKSLERVGQYFRALNAPVVHVLGNHDRRDLSPDDFKEVLGSDCFATTITLGGVDLCFLDSELDNMVPFFTEGVLSLLQDCQKSSLRPRILFSHHPLADYCVEGNENWSPTNVHKAFPSNRAEACSLVDNIPGVIACVNGHLHANYSLKRGGTQFITVQCLVDNFRNDGTPAASYGVLEIGSKSSQLQVFGNDRACFSIDRGLANAL